MIVHRDGAATRADSVAYVAVRLLSVLVGLVAVACGSVMTRDSTGKDEADRQLFRRASSEWLSLYRWQIRIGGCLLIALGIGVAVVGVLSRP